MPSDKITSSLHLIGCICHLLKSAPSKIDKDKNSLKVNTITRTQKKQCIVHKQKYYFYHSTHPWIIDHDIWDLLGPQPLGSNP